MNEFELLRKASLADLRGNYRLADNLFHRATRLASFGAVVGKEIFKAIEESILKGIDKDVIGKILILPKSVSEKVALLEAEGVSRASAEQLAKRINTDRSWKIFEKTFQRMESSSSSEFSKKVTKIIQSQDWLNLGPKIYEKWNALSPSAKKKITVGGLVTASGIAIWNGTKWMFSDGTETSKKEIADGLDKAKKDAEEGDDEFGKNGPDEGDDEFDTDGPDEGDDEFGKDESEPKKSRRPKPGKSKSGENSPLGPSFGSPAFGSPGMGGPGMSSPGMGGPAMGGPAMGGPGLGSAGIYSPGADSKDKMYLERMQAGQQQRQNDAAQKFVTENMGKFTNQRDFYNAALAAGDKNFANSAIALVKKDSSLPI